MIDLPKLLTAFVFCLATPVLAADDSVLPNADDEIAMYREVGEWTVFENRSRNSCFISRSDDEGNLVQMGLTKDKDFGYVGIFKRDADLPEGTDAVAVVLNDVLYVGTATNVVKGVSGNFRGGYILAEDPQFRRDLEASEQMVVFPSLPFTITVNLGSARTAIFEARACTDKLQGA